MKIAQIATIDTPVRRDVSGSVEQLIWLLDRELTAMGHDVTVFATGGSLVSGRLVETLPGSYGINGTPEDWRICEWINLCRALEQSGDFDILHSHAYLLGLPCQNLSRAPLLHTLHVTPYDDQIIMRQLRPEAPVIAISEFQWSRFPNLKPCAIIPHGIDIEQFTFRPEPEDYVCFLGRFIPDKGAITAIRAAQSLGIRIKLAGPRNEYFESDIEPLIDGRGVEYIGEVTGATRDALLGGARALLYPIEGPEPFGLVQTEAMMCGTPVVAHRIGAVPEIIEEGVTGFSAQPGHEFVHAIPQSFSLDRKRIRERAVARFSSRRMAEQHLETYQQIVRMHAQ